MNKLNKARRKDRLWKNLLLYRERMAMVHSQVWMPGVRIASAHLYMPFCKYEEYIAAICGNRRRGA